MEKIGGLVMRFRGILLCGWEPLGHCRSIIESDALIDDWMQFHWELIVECGLRTRDELYLNPYGSGADFNGESSRILLPEKLPTHEVCCCPKVPYTEHISGVNRNDIGKVYSFDSFVSTRGAWYVPEPPFDCVLLSTDEDPKVIPLDVIDWRLRRLV